MLFVEDFNNDFTVNGQRLTLFVFHFVDTAFWWMLQVRCFKVVGSLLSKQNAGMSKHNQNILFHTNAVIPLKTSQQVHTRLVTTLDLRHSGINTQPLPRYPRNLSVTLQLTQPPPTLKDVRAQNFPGTDFVKTLTAGRE